MPRPAAAVLVDFGAFRPGQGERREWGAAAPQSAAAPAEDKGLREAAAYARGKAEGLAQAQVAAETAARRAASEVEERLETERRRWVVDEGERLAGLFAGAAATLGGEIGDAVAAILSPVMTEAARDAAVAELTEQVRTLFAGGGKPPLRISGPEDLLARIRHSLGDLAASAVFTAADSVDLFVATDHTCLETRLGNWLRRTMPRPDPH